MPVSRDSGSTCASHLRSGQAAQAFLQNTNGNKCNPCLGWVVLVFAKLSQLVAHLKKRSHILPDSLEGLQRYARRNLLGRRKHNLINCVYLCDGECRKTLLTMVRFAWFWRFLKECWGLVRKYPWKHKLKGNTTYEVLPLFAIESNLLDLISVGVMSVFHAFLGALKRWQ